jgi:hypothetical protein
MFGSTILDVAIGMVFVYLLISLICSALNETVEAWLKNRSKDLEKGILNLLGDPGLVKQLYNHPLIKALYPQGGDKPSYIPSRTFSLALWNMATYARDGAEAASAVSRSLPEIRKTVAGLQDSQLKRALLTLMDEAGDDLEQARKNVERWYDDAMDRVSGWYKRRSQKFLLAFGFIFAVALNIDSVRIADKLYLDTPRRNAIVAAAQGYAAAADKKDSKVSTEEIKKNYETIQTLGLPIGWTKEEFSQAPGSEWSKWKWTGVLGLKLIGLFLTGLAVSLGAPFWFDVLNKFMVVRSTIKPQEKSQETPSKDKRPAPTPTGGDGGDGEEADPAKNKDGHG